jgi:TolB-like protein
MKHLLILLLAALCAAPAYGQSKKKVAVYVTGDADAGTKKVIGAKLVSAITKDSEYAAVERTADFLSELSKEQSYQRSGAVDDNQIVKVGQQFGVNFVCIADLSNVYGSLFVSARLINVQTGMITATAERDKEINGMADLTEISDDVADGLVNSTAPCNKKDKPVDSKGCCAGLQAIDGICRDMSGDIYWITECPKKFLAKVMPKKKYTHTAYCPEGYRVADASELSCLYETPYGRRWLGLGYYWCDKESYGDDDCGDKVFNSRRMWRASSTTTCVNTCGNEPDCYLNEGLSYVCIRE